MNLKIEAARRQLGMALDLHIRGLDPVSVHCLASGGCEVIEHFAAAGEQGSLSAFLLEQNPDLKIADLRKLQRQHWNAFKHATGKSEGSAARADDELLQAFSSRNNDAPLFVGWTDYGNATGMMPIEAQVFVAWYLAKYPAKAAPDNLRDEIDRMFPGLPTQRPAKQRAELVRAIERARKNKIVMADPKTEHRPLVLGWPPA